MAKIPRSIGTHNGMFHADEVTASALLVVYDLADKDKIIRTRDADKLATCEYVCDVGGEYDPSRKLFDHHQKEYVGDKSSAGMILLFLKESGVISDKEYHALNGSLVRGVDAFDNGKVPFNLGYCTFSQLISNFSPITYEATEEEMNQAFMEALNFTIGHLSRFKERFHYIQQSRDVVDALMKKYKDCIIFNEAVPWMENFFDLGGDKHPANFIIMPSGTHWKLRGIPPTYEERTKVRVPLPLSWAGLLDEDLKEASGISGAIFCHKGRFISVWETKEDALKAYEKVRSQ